MTPPIDISGKVRDRFIKVAALLRLLDPVRGEPTAYGLDQDNYNVQDPSEAMVKRKFLDSIALICSINKGGDYVSAASLDEDGPEGTVIRVASNAGIASLTLSHLNDILRDLRRIAFRGEATAESKMDILRKIIRLDSSKIRKYIQDLLKAKGVSEEELTDLPSRLAMAIPSTTAESIRQLMGWIRKLNLSRDRQTELTEEIMFDWVNWALQARQGYLILFKAAFLKPDKSVPRWASLVFKLSRYAIAAKAFAKFAVTNPDTFDQISICPIDAPKKVRFQFQPEEEFPLSTWLVRRMPDLNTKEITSRLRSILNSTDPEASFRAQCCVELATHAELQIVSFYDDNPNLKSQFRFIGVSKKSCYLCKLFLETHPDGYSVSSCHQKLYLSIPPPAIDPDVYHKYKDFTARMSHRMEGIAKDDLVNKLGLRRSIWPADSTAGVSLTGLTDLQSVRAWQTTADTTAATEIGSEYGGDDNSGASLNTFEIVSRPLEHEFQSGSSSNTSLRTSGVTPMGTNDTEIFETDSDKKSPKFVGKVSSIVLHFKMQDDELREDIILVHDILDPQTQDPSWAKLLELMNPGDRFGLIFQSNDSLRFNSGIRVRNEKQFLAHLQYLLNSDTLNAEVTICSEPTDMTKK